MTYGSVYVLKSLNCSPSVPCGTKRLTGNMHFNSVGGLVQYQLIGELQRSAAEHGNRIVSDYKPSVRSNAAGNGTDRSAYSRIRILPREHDLVIGGEGRTWGRCIDTPLRTPICSSQIEGDVAVGRNDALVVYVSVVLEIEPHVNNTCMRIV